MCGHAELDCAWLTGQCEFVLILCVTSLQVREVIVVLKRQVFRPASNSFQVKEFAGKCFLLESVQH